MTHIVIGVSGGIGVGKSEFIRALAERIGAATTGFGDCVRDEAAARGLDPSSRDVLQEIGAQLKSELGDDGFVARVLSRAPNDAPVIVDGVRHVEIADAIQRVVTPRRFALVFLDADEDVRRARAMSSRPDDAARLALLATHSTEQQVHDGSLRARADAILDATAPVGALVDQAVRALAIGG